MVSALRRKLRSDNLKAKKKIEKKTTEVIEVGGVDCGSAGTVTCRASLCHGVKL